MHLRGQRIAVCCLVFAFTLGASAYAEDGAVQIRVLRGRKYSLEIPSSMKNQPHQTAGESDGKDATEPSAPDADKRPEKPSVEGVAPPSAPVRMNSRKDDGLIVDELNLSWTDESADKKETIPVSSINSQPTTNAESTSEFKQVATSTQNSNAFDAFGWKSVEETAVIHPVLTEPFTSEVNDIVIPSLLGSRVDIPIESVIDDVDAVSQQINQTEGFADSTQMQAPATEFPPNPEVALVDSQVQTTELNAESVAERDQPRTTDDVEAQESVVAVTTSENENQWNTVPQQTQTIPVYVPQPVSIPVESNQSSAGILPLMLMFVFGFLLSAVAVWVASHSAEEKIPKVIQLVVEASDLVEKLSASGRFIVAGAPEGHVDPELSPTAVVDMGDDPDVIPFSLGKTFVQQQEEEDEMRRLRSEEICKALFEDNLNWQRSAASA